MTTKEFIRELEELGYEVTSLNDVLIVSVLSEVVVIVDKRNTHTINTSYTTFAKLNEENKERLMYLVLEYSSTPIVGRVEEEKFYWKLKSLGDFITDFNSYLNFYIRGNNYQLGSNNQDDNYRTQWSENNYNAMVDAGLIPDIFEKEAIEN